MRFDGRAFARACGYEWGHIGKAHWPTHEGIYVFAETQDPDGLVWGDSVKIGMASNIKSRLISHQSSNSKPIALLAVQPGEPGILEADAHAKFARERQSGEWFRLSVRLCAWIDGLRRDYPATLRRLQRDLDREELNRRLSRWRS